MRFAATFALLWGMSALCAAELVNDSTRADIVIPARPHPELVNIAHMLQKYIEKSTTVKLPVVHADRPEEGKAQIIIRVEDNDRLSRDGFIIEASGSKVVISANNTFSAGCGARDFLRRYCGVRWFMPGELWTVVKKQRRLSVPDGKTVTEPSFKSRWHSLGNSPWNAQNWEWLRNQGSINRYDFHHAYHRFFPGKKYGTKHPEYYSLVSGRRMIPGPGSVQGWQVCMTNPGVVDEFAAYARNLNANMLSISLSPNDGASYCECPECRKLWGDSGDRDSSRTKLVFNLVNHVAARLAKESPGKLAGILIYADYQKPVPDLKIEPNVIGYIVGCRSSGREEAKAAEREKVKMWKKAGLKHFGIYEWAHGYFFNVPVLYPHRLAEDMKFYAANGATGWYSEDYPSWGLQGPAHWIAARLLWDVNLNVDDLLDEYCGKLFGKAMPEMRKYFARCEEQWSASTTGGGMAGTNQYAAYPPAVRRELAELLDKALAKVENSCPEYTRVRFFRESFAFSDRACAAYESGENALKAVQAENYAEALSCIGRVARPAEDPELYMKMVLDNWPLINYYKSGTLDNNFYTCSRELLKAKIALAAPAMREAGQKIMKAGKVTEGAYSAAVDEALAKLLPASRSNEMRESARAVAQLAGKSVFAPQAEQPPVVDGKLDDPAWKDLPWNGGFYAYGGSAAAKYPTFFKAVYRKGRLYVAVKCMQDMTNPKASTIVRDGKVWLDDAVEIFLDRPDAAENEYFQAVVNINGVVFDMFKNDAAENFEIETGGQRAADHWTLEFSIPLDKIGMSPEQFSGLRFNLVRDTWGAGPGKPVQISCWFPTFFGHGDKNLRGWLFFAK